MSSKDMRKIGLVLASIHTGASNGFWADVAAVAQRSGDSLFVFPGGRLECPQDFEYLKNTLFNLANPKNIDGLISWGSSLGGSVSIEEVKAFHKRFGSLPCVTIGMKQEGIPDISFDAYAGVHSELSHCIIAHKASRIAFIRGPENHQSSNDRYQAYLDVLKAFNLPFDPCLVSDPFGWTEGSKALDQLVTKRGLVPGKDFDTLACASDLMMFDAGKILEKRGIQIPSELRILGFNDSSESHLLKIPCTTAKMPVKQMALLSWSLVEDMLDKDTLSGPDLLLPAECIIRRSCGCEDSLGGIEKARNIFVSEQAFLEWLANEFEITEKTMQREIIPLFALAAAYTGKEKPVLDEIKAKLENLCYAFLDAGGDSNRLSEALFWYEQFFATLGFRQELSGPVRDVFLRQQDLVSTEHAYALSLQKKKLNSLEYDLLCVRSLHSISAILEKHLPLLGLPQGYLVMYVDEETSNFVGGYDSNRIFQEEELFEKDLLLPPHLFKGLGQGVYVVEPLFMENQSLGYLVAKTESFDGSLLEDLRTALSSTIKGTFLIEAANKARELAECAQRSRTEFFVNVSEGLRNPLDSILHLFDSLKAKNISDIDVEETFQAVENQVSTVNHLLDLTLSQTGALGLDFQILNCSSLLQDFLSEGNAQYKGNLDLPAVFGDKKRLLQVFSIIRNRILSEGYHCIVTSDVGADGLHVTLQSDFPGWKSDLYRQDPGFSLVERILVMSGGLFSCKGNQVTISLPWPTLGGKLISLPVQVPSVSFFISETEGKQLPGGFGNLGPVDTFRASDIGRKGIIPPSIQLIAWDARKGDLELQLALHVLRRNPTAVNLPFVCLGCPDGFSNIADALESLGLMSEGGTIYVFGELPQALSSLVFPELLVHVSSFAQFKELAAQRPPALMISTNSDYEDIEAIRKGTIASSVPIVLVRETWGEAEVERLCLIPNILIANTSIVDSNEFHSRLMGLLCGSELLPPLTGILVKRAVVYLSNHATSQISRWQLAEAVHVSEDYLTRIFRKEIGLSPWDYLNRHRMYLATKLLRQTGLSINEVASQTGFQDQAYFCRVFKKIKGYPPGSIRTKK
ncbi:transcriptional regulator [Sphaerochaeta pleomorpha str. Grapes]|uniref:histidine kinase n=1 Tax=Sphaerochaeta pleomorpha (strain ATCC BAA-1885 / DSM 22778 / Grapes) TaxID=158190 RepID=G8QQC3_SPHPG|nr:helix-turn-helix domain-containing protein [Sphaerochaeta pleomorpha]AEV29768.1 transcriptional regulator [Sphaerochaeta pleomorpha str. Grapes]